MMAENYTKRLEELLEGQLNTINVELVNVEYRMENKDQMLRIFIDHSEGVDLGLCTEVTKLVKKLIDDTDINYDHLEVSSPGLDRIIKRNKHPERFIGQQVKVKTLKSFPGPRKLVGILTQVNDEMITVADDTDNYEIFWDVVTTLRLHSDFN